MISSNALFLLLFLFSINAVADFKLADSYYAAGKLKEAYSEFYLLATNGDHDAQFNLGAMNLHGQSVAINVVSAYAWVALSAQDKDEKRLELKKVILELIPDEKKSEAIEKEAELLLLYSDKALEQKMTPQFNAADFQGQQAIKKVKIEYPNDLRRSGDEGFVEISYSIDKSGVPHDFGFFTSPGKSAADAVVHALRQWRYEPARADGKAVETYNQKLRISFALNGLEAETEASYKKALNKLRVKAETGKPIDMYAFAHAADILASGGFVKIDGKTINEYYLRAAEKGFAPAQFQLGARMLVGNAGSASSVAAQLWLTRAALAGLPDAQYLLASEMMTGARLIKNEAAAMLWLERAANADYAFAEIKLAWMLATHPDANIRNGKHAEYYLKKVPQDYSDRAKYYETQAAVYAELGDFQQAIEWQNKALGDAKEFDLPLQPVLLRFDAYSKQKAWTEEL